MPHSGAKADAFVGSINDCLPRYGIDVPERIAAWLGQIAVESGEFRYVREIWGPTKLQLTYEGRIDLGNTQSGDGFRFRGRGLIQITGRANYEAAAKALGADLLDKPELLETPALATASACWFWQAHGLNELADARDYVAITRRINGGLSHYTQRVEYIDRARAVLGLM